MCISLVTQEQKHFRSRTYGFLLQFNKRSCNLFRGTDESYGMEIITCIVVGKKAAPWSSTMLMSSSQSNAFGCFKVCQFESTRTCLVYIKYVNISILLSTKLELKVNMEKIESDLSEGDALFGRIDTVQDIRKLRSSYYHVNDI